MSALGIQELEDEIDHLDSNLAENINPARTRNNSLTESTQNEILNIKKTNQNKKKISFGVKSQHDEYKPVVLNHVTLTLNFVNKKANVLPSWKYNNVKKKPVKLNHNNSSSSNDVSFTSDHSNKKYVQNSFFLTSSNQIESFNGSLNNSDAQFNKRPETARIIADIKQSTPENGRRNSSSSSDESILNITTFQNNQTKQYHQYVPSPLSSYKSSFIDYKSRPKTGNQSLYIDTTHLNLGSSLSSNDSARNSGRHSYSVAEFNRFKNNLLKSTQRLEHDYQKQQKTKIQPIMNTNGVSPSAIKSIYESIEREKRIKTYSIEARRSNYLNSLTKTHTFLANSLVIKKI